MKLHEFKTLLEAHRDKLFALQLPDDSAVPRAFHITEVGHVNKRFIDCGGQTHTVETCHLQAWIGPDIDHRIEAGKMSDILKKAAAIVPNDSLDIEIEYEDTVISQYQVAGAAITDDAVTLRLTTKHTACLAPELCIVPSGGSCCAPSSGCC